MSGELTVLGAVLAGGEARRFGSDKALALFEARPLIDHVIARLAPQTDGVVVVGRDHAGLARVEDRPAHGLGPLGAIAGALHWGRAHGFDAVLTVPCDTPLLPLDLAHALAGEGAALVDGLPVIGWWPTTLSGALDAWLAEDRSRAVRHWAAAVGARSVVLETLPANVNTVADLDGLSGA